MVLQLKIKPDYKKIGRRVKEAREEKNLSQQELSKECGCTISHLSRLENGRVGASLEMLFNISVELGKSMDYFFMDEPYAKPETVIDQSLAEKLKGCDSQTLVMIGKIADQLKEYRESILRNPV